MWEACGRHLADIWAAPGDSRMLQEAPGGLGSKNRCLSRLECKSCMEMLILHCVFVGKITQHNKLHGKMLPGSVDGASHQARPLSNTVRTPTDKSAWGTKHLPFHLVRKAAW